MNMKQCCWSCLQGFGQDEGGDRGEARYLHVFDDLVRFFHHYLIRVRLEINLGRTELRTDYNNRHRCSRQGAKFPVGLGTCGLRSSR